VGGPWPVARPSAMIWRRFTMPSLVKVDPVLAGTVDPEAAIFGEHADRKIMQPVFVLAEQSGDIADREDGADRRHDQAAWLRGIELGRQFHGSNSSIRLAGCPATSSLSWL